MPSVAVLEVFQTDSAQPRVVLAGEAVPPTEVTYGEAAGYSAP